MDTFAFLRAKARECRDIARLHDDDGAAALRAIADELEAKAVELERLLLGLLGPRHPDPAARPH